MLHRLLLLGAVAASLAGCQSMHNTANFSRPEPDALKLGHMTQEEVMTAYGAPLRQETETVAVAAEPGQAAAPAATLTVQKLHYRYMEFNPLLQGRQAEKHKTLTFQFANGRLYSYLFMSELADSSNFAEARYNLIVPGKTTRAELLEIFGPPGGRAVFPAVPPEMEAWIYNHSIIGNWRQLDKRMEILLDRDGIVRDASQSNERKAAPRAPMAMPIFIPAK